MDEAGDLRASGHATTVSATYKHQGVGRIDGWSLGSDSSGLLYPVFIAVEILDGKVLSVATPCRAREGSEVDDLASP